LRFAFAVTFQVERAVTKTGRSLKPMEAASTQYG
jgi:hypothetical protein